MLLFVYMTGVHPIYKKYRSYKQQREDLVKKYNRLWRSRKDLLMHMDWAISRADPPRDIENMGNEVERIDRELNEIDEEIQLLDRNKLNPVPLKSLKTSQS